MTTPYQPFISQLLVDDPYSLSLSLLVAQLFTVVVSFLFSSVMFLFRYVMAFFKPQPLLERWGRFFFSLFLTSVMSPRLYFCLKKKIAVFSSHSGLPDVVHPARAWNARGGCVVYRLPFDKPFFLFIYSDSLSGGGNAVRLVLSQLFFFGLCFSRVC